MSTWLIRWDRHMPRLKRLLTPNHLAMVDEGIAKQLLWMLQQSEETLHDLQVRFVVPGHDDVELCDGGAERVVDISNREAYVALVCQYLTFDLVQYSLRRLCEGFNDSRVRRIVPFG